jgi:hypothetical protein
MNRTFQSLYNEAYDMGAGGGGAGAGGAASGGAGSNLFGGSVGAAGGGGTAGGAASGGGGAPDGGSVAGASAPAQGSSAEAWHSGLWDNTGKINAAAWDRLPEHLKPHKETFAKYQTAEALLGGFSNLAQLAGKKGLAPLPEGASEEAKTERAKLMRQLNGVPEKPEDYGVKKPDDLPDESWNGEYVNSMVGIMHKYNAPPAMVRELLEADVKYAGSTRQQSEAAQAAALQGEGKKLREAWGADFDKKLGGVRRVAETLGLDTADPIFRSAHVMQALSKVADMVSEDKLVTGNSSSNSLGGDDRAKALDVVNNPSNPLYSAYHDPRNPLNAHAVETVLKFNEAYHRRKKSS